MTNKTPGYNIRLLIRLSFDRRGQKLAHYWSRAALRWIRVSANDAEFWIATGAADKSE